MAMSEDPDPLAEPGDGDDGDSGVSWVARHRRSLVRGTVTALVAIVATVALFLSWRYLGPVATIVYALAFTAGLTFLPLMVAGLRDMTPNLVGQLTFALGQLAFGEGWLVQKDDQWEMCPGRTADGESEVYVEGEWHAVPDTANQTILGWQPFGILLWKDNETLAEVRVDDDAKSEYDEITATGRDSAGPSAEEIATMSTDELVSQTVGENGEAVADGGQQTVERGGIEAVEPDDDLREADGVWLIDLTRYWSRGLDKIGDISLITKVEEVTMRDEAVENTTTRAQYGIMSVVGLLLGGATAYVIMASG